MDTYSIISGQGCPHTLVYSVFVLKYLKISHCDKFEGDLTYLFNMSRGESPYVDMGHSLWFSYMEKG